MLCMIFIHLSFLSLDLGQECGISCWMFQENLKIIFILLLMVTYSKNVNWIQFIDGSVQSHYIVTDFLSVCSANYWYGTVEISNCNSGFANFSLHFYQFYSLIISCSIVRCIHVEDFYFLGEQTLLSISNAHFYHDNVTAFPNSDFFSEINIVIPTSLICVSMVYPPPSL